ncbi:kinetochore scaffold 1 isoform X3 [Meleagris gallopavo]|uniref:Kinetochore scaffold 1 n=1 Tax=Meleagris gallopavo TaxID=9103 RepID=A0A803Y487_MELGA|nr:kinetochore scaffold 1 isoform X3 [Meleagris gallopavo]
MLYGALGGAMLYGAASRTAVWRGAQAWRLGLNCEAAAAAQPHGRCGAEGQRRRAAVSVPYFIGETLLAEMDKIYVDSNMENDNTEHIRGKRLSSILKAPRNPLDDLGNGNELTQDLNIEKRRKSSRRVSFADTINCRVFHRDVKNNAAERENEAEDTENHVLLNQNEEPEAVPCEITGMNTLLHAPIQSLVQQTECHDVDNAIPRTDRPDTTLIFSDENEMDMTTSHTSVIARNLKNNNETDKTEKIDIVSFLAELNSANGKAEKSKDFHFSFAADRFCSSFEQKEDAATRKKINSNGFFMNSNEKALNPIEGPEKENIFFVPSQVSENMAQSSYAYSHEQLATCNVTKIFREQDDGMEMTKCQASDIQNMHSGLYEVPTEQLPSADVTQAFADDEMDMTTNHTAKMHFPFAIVSNQNLNFKKDFLSLEQDNYSVVKRTSHQKLIIMQDPQLCTSKKIINVEDTVDATALQAFKQETRTLSSIPGSVSSETVFRDDKTVVFSQCDDMEITGNYRDVVYNTSTKGMNSSCHKAFEKPVSRNSLLVERKHPVNTGSTRSLSLDDRTSLSHKNNARELSSGSDGQNERVIQDHSTASLNTGFNSCTNSVSTGSSRGRLQHRLANSLLVSLPGRKAAPGHIEDKSKISLKKEVMMMNNQKQPECDMYSGVSDKKMLTVTGIKHLLSADEKTTIFSEGANMDITGNHTASADNKTILQPEILNDDISFISEDKTSVFTKNNDMEISRLDSVAADNSMEKAVSQGMLSRTNGARRKSLKGTIGEKTVLFSMSENNDMSITEGLTAAINHEIISQNEVGLPSPSSAHPVRTVTFTSNQADIDTKSCSANKITVKVSCDDALISDKIVGQDVPSNREDTTFAMDDMEITKAHNVSLKENFLQGRQPNQSVPLTSSVMFTSDQADMEMTEYHPIDGRFEKDLCEDRLNLPTQVVQEALSGSKTVIFPLAENMDITKTHDVLSGKIGVWNGRSISAISAVPADKTIVFCHNQDDMEITSSHTIAVNNNTEGFENQEASLKSTQQPDLHSASSSSCRDEIDSLQIKDLNGRDHKISNTKPLIPSASSPSASPIEKGPIKVHSGTIPDSTYSVSIPKDALDVQALQDLGLSTENSIPINSEQDLLHPGAMKSRRVSLKLPGNVPLDCSEESEVVISHVFLPAQHSDSLKEPPDALSTQRNQVLKDDSCKHEDLATGLAMDGAGIVSVSKKESEENVPSAEGETTEFQINSGQTGSLNPVDLAPKLSGILNICSKLENIRRKSVVVSETVLSDHLAKLPTQPEDTLRLGRNSINEQRLCYAKEQENAYLESGTASIDANVGMALKDKYKRRNVPLGIFQPKLPNRRNPSVSSVQDINVKSSGKAESPVPEVNPNTVKAPGYDKSSRQNFSPSQFIAEEFLPVCPEEMDSNDSVSSEFVEEACNNSNKREVSHNEKIQVEETKSCNNAKRALKYVEEDLQSLKKLKMDETVVGGTSQDLQVTYGPVPESHTEVAESEDSPNISAKNSDCTQANSSSSLDSVKADTELTIQRSSQMESQLLTDSICEDNLWEKFQSGGITVGEFFTLLQVHVPIQKPRQSHIPASCAVSAPPTPEDLILSQYVYRPKMRIYEEDCQVLSQMIDELKQYVSVQDQPLVNVNKSLWEVMRTCSDEELKSFGAELNKMKSYFIKESKILAHNEKEALYSKLLQSAQEQYEKLQSRIANMDELLKEAESCLADLEADSEWEECETDCSDDEMEGEDSESRKLEEELGSLKAQEEELQRELSDLETENEQILAQMKHLQEDEKSCQELLERCNFTEWEISEWSERQAVFNFLYDSIELTVVFGTPIDGDVFGENPSRKIVSLSFESLLDEEKAPLSSCLVQRLIFQFIESQGCWQEKCPMLQYLPQVLHDVSLVVSRCRILGEEIEFLKKWGGKYNLLKTDIIDTNVKLLFSTSTAFAKFELTLSLSSNYPSSSLPFTVEKKIGNIGHEEISAVLSKVPIGYHYLRRMVSLIHQNLLQDPR